MQELLQKSKLNNGRSTPTEYETNHDRRNHCVLPHFHHVTNILLLQSHFTPKMSNLLPIYRRFSLVLNSTPYPLFCWKKPQKLQNPKSEHTRQNFSKLTVNRFNDIFSIPFHILFSSFPCGIKFSYMLLIAIAYVPISRKRKTNKEGCHNDVGCSAQVSLQRESNQLIFVFQIPNDSQYILCFCRLMCDCLL